MKSQIKVDYAGLHKGLDDENKQPIIRIDLQKSDDPRDTLLNDLVRPNTIWGFRLKDNHEGLGIQTYVLYAKGRVEQTYELAENAFLILKNLWLKGEELLLVTAYDEIYFECTINEKRERSKGVNKDDLSFLQKDEIIKMIVEDFEVFKEQLLRFYRQVAK